MFSLIDALSAPTPIKNPHASVQNFVNRIPEALDLRNRFIKFYTNMFRFSLTPEAALNANLNPNPDQNYSILNILLNHKKLKSQQFSNEEYSVLIRTALEAGADPNLPTGSESIFLADADTLFLLVRSGADLKAKKTNEKGKKITFLDKILSIHIPWLHCPVENVLFGLDATEDFKDLDNAYQISSSAGGPRFFEENGMTGLVSFSNPYSVICQFAECIAIFDQSLSAEKLALYDLVSVLGEAINQNRPAGGPIVPPEVANIIKAYVPALHSSWSAQPRNQEFWDKMQMLGRKVIAHKKGLVADAAAPALLNNSASVGSSLTPAFSSSVAASSSSACSSSSSISSAVSSASVGSDHSPPTSPPALR